MALIDTKRVIKGIKQGLLLRRAVTLGDTLLGTSCDVLRCSQTLGVFQAGINTVVASIHLLLGTPMLF